MKSVEFELDNAIMRVAVAEMNLRYGYTVSDIQHYAAVLQKVAAEIEKIAERAKQEAA